MGKNKKKELSESKCPYCNGNGHVISLVNLENKIECFKCKGTGVVKK